MTTKGMAKYPSLELTEHSPDHAALKANYKGHYTLLCTENVCIQKASKKIDRFNRLLR